MKVPTFSSVLGLDFVRQAPTGSTKTSADIQNDASINPVEKYGEKVTEISWQAPSRGAFNISPKAVRTLLVICVAVSLLFAVMQEFVLILVIASAGFLAYMLSKSEPGQVSHEINTHGISFAGESFYYWHDLSYFFFKSLGDGTEILCVDTLQGVPGRLFFHFVPQQKETLKELLSKRIDFVAEEPRSVVDKVFNKAVSRLNLDR